jgi:hypothetical protein
MLPDEFDAWVKEYKSQGADFVLVWKGDRFEAP